MSEAAEGTAPESAAHAEGAAHRAAMMPAHGGTASAPHAHKGESPETGGTGKGGQDQKKEDEAQHVGFSFQKRWR